MTVNGIQQEYYAASANIKLANASKQEQENFAKPEIQNALKTAKSIALFDANKDGKLGDNEYLVIQSHDNSFSVLYSPKKGTDKASILNELSGKYSIDASKIPEKIDCNSFLQIPLKKPDEQLARGLKRILNENKTYNFSVQMLNKADGELAVLSYNKPNASKIRKLFNTDKPSFGYIKEKLGLKDGVLTAYNDIYYCSGHKKPDGTSAPCASNNFDKWTLEPGRELYIPTSELYKK